MKLYPPPVRAYTNLARNSASDETAETPDTRSPLRFNLWMLGRQRGLIAINAVLYLVYYLPGILNPYLLSRIVDDGIIAGNWAVTWRLTIVMVILIVVGVACSAGGHFIGVACWLVSMFRVTKLVIRKVGQMSHVVTRRVPAGEMLSVANSDSDNFGAVVEYVSRLIVAVVSFGFVAVVVIRENLGLGRLVLVATPMVVIVTIPLLRPLQRAQQLERERASKLTGMAVDIVSGLRILRGIGGERTFGDNYAKQSQSVRQAGVRAGTWWASLDGVGAITTGALLVGLTWFGIRELTQGQLTIGQLVGFFGYAIFLQRPVMIFYEFFQRWTLSLVSAAKTIALLSQDPPWVAPDQIVSPPSGQIVDSETGFTAEPGQLTIIVAPLPDQSAALADRIGRYLPADMESLELSISRELKGKAERKESAKRAAARARQVRQDERLACGTWGVSLAGVDLSEMDLGEVRQRIVVSDASTAVFQGTLQTLVDPHGTHTRTQAEEALWATSAEDVWEAFADGWQGLIDEKGRGLSGGQRQRMVLARVLLMNPEILVAVEPTSAVDAHTEARIAERLPAYRRGRTTIMTTVSPLWLRRADKVAFLLDGRVAAQGSHKELMATCEPYRATVVRDGAAPQTSGGGK
ncbi:MAG: ABC transporter ATP-binding protein/permease [Propionibacteriaceae bacterium]|jgi:ABC-type multidrug transport system fused ATPase/permease subunit|nr:ABC transporter ATP-binding protein/permease [Propionibacteriaceae bacterium]